MHSVESVFRVYGFTPFTPPPVEYSCNSDSVVTIANAFEGAATLMSLPGGHAQSIALFVKRHLKEITYPDKRSCIGYSYTAQNPVCLASASVVSPQLREVDLLDCVSAALDALKVLQVRDLVVRIQSVADCVLGCPKEGCICELLHEKLKEVTTVITEGKNASIFSVFSNDAEIVSTRRFDELLPNKLQGLCMTINLSELQAKEGTHE